MRRDHSNQEPRPESSGDPAQDRVYEVLREKAARLPVDVRDDVLQIAVLKILRSSRNWAELENLEGYCIKVLKTALLDHLADGLSAGPLDESALELAFEPDETTAEDLGHLMSFLHPRDAEVLRRRYLEGMNVPEIVTMMRSTGRVATRRSVQSRLERARERLRDLLLANGFGTAVVVALLHVLGA